MLSKNLTLMLMGKNMDSSILEESVKVAKLWLEEKSPKYYSVIESLLRSFELSY
jgi:hypothetical protein